MTSQKFFIEDWTGKEVPNTTWTVLRFGVKAKSNLTWTCQCRCGRIRNVRVCSLFNGRSVTCRSCAKDKGGFLDKKGYRVIKKPSHPNSWRNGQMFQHVYVMSSYLGRPLRKGETVHHINGIKNDNCISNLQLRMGNHGSGQTYACLDCGSGRIGPVELA